MLLRQTQSVSIEADDEAGGIMVQLKVCVVGATGEWLSVGQCLGSTTQVGPRMSIRLFSIGWTGSRLDRMH